jgi:hypothetical protein
LSIAALLFWFSCFRAEDLNVNIYDVRWTVMAKVHMAYGHSSKLKMMAL